MSKYEETSDTCNRKCPYCGDEYQVEAEDYDEDVREEECGECGKKFYACDEFSIEHTAKPDCDLNNDPHDWQPCTANYLKCDACGEFKEKGDGDA